MKFRFKYWPVLVLLVLCRFSLAQDKKFYPPDYKSVKAVSLTGGLIGLGVGGEVRADISIGKFMVYGSAGYKGYGARDSSISIGGKSYQQVIVSDGRGPVLKLGMGMRIRQSERTKVEFVATDVYMTEDAFYYYLHYTGSNRDLPHLKSLYVMLNVSSIPTGIYHRGPATGSSVFISGNNVYVSALLRSMDEVAPINRVAILDYGPVVSSDFRQAGAMINFFLINHRLNYSMGCALIRRFDKPDNVIDPFEGDGMYKWGFPFHFTFGGTFIRLRRASDFERKKP